MTDNDTGAERHDSSAVGTPGCVHCGIPRGQHRPAGPLFHGFEMSADRDARLAAERIAEADRLARTAAADMPRGWAVLVRFLGPTDYRGARWVATGDHPIGRAVVSYDYEARNGIENARTAADALIARWAADYAIRYPDAPAWPHRIIAGGHLPNGDYAFIVA